MREETYYFRAYASPIDHENEVEMQLTLADLNKTGRGIEPWEATVTDQVTGKKFVVSGAECSLPGCMCAAQIIKYLED